MTAFSKNLLFVCLFVWSASGTRILLPTDEPTSESKGQFYDVDNGLGIDKDNFGVPIGLTLFATVGCNGKLYIGGGNSKNISQTAIYEHDPRSGLNVKFGDLNVARKHFTMTCIEGKKFIACGGTGNDGKTLSSCEICSLGCAYCKTINSQMPETVEGHSAVFTKGSLFVIMGKISATAISAQIHQYDFATDMWSTLQAKITGARYDFGCAVVGENILMCGGAASSMTTYTTCYMYDFVKHSIIKRADMQQSSKQPALIADHGVAYAFESDSSLVYLYDPMADEWSKANNNLFTKTTRAASAVLIPPAKCDMY